jgi:hypothetical protein
MWFSQCFMEGVWESNIDASYWRRFVMIAIFMFFAFAWYSLFDTLLSIAEHFLFRRKRR